jgi:hypothetical protein
MSEYCSATRSSILWTLGGSDSPSAICLSTAAFMFCSRFA